MTTIAACAVDGRVHMAGDTATNVYERPIFGGARKILRLAAGTGEILLAVAGMGGLAGVLAAGVQVDSQPVEGEDAQPWAHAVAAACTELATDAGLVEEGQIAGTLLLGWNGRLWTLTHYMAVPHSDGIAAIGSGEGPAIGALDVLLARDTDPTAAVVEAVRVGIARDRFSAGPVQVEVLD